MSQEDLIKATKESLKDLSDEGLEKVAVAVPAACELFGVVLSKEKGFKMKLLVSVFEKLIAEEKLRRRETAE